MSNIETYVFNEFKYQIDYSLPTNLPEIVHNFSNPEFVYKFYSLSKYSIEALTENYLYASHPLELNDILDSSPFLFYTSKPIDFNIYKKFYRTIFDTEDELREFYEQDVKDNQCRTFLTQAYNMSFNLLGIISLTAKENNTLMWPHYTQEKGIQIKFKTSELIQSVNDILQIEDGELFGFHPINYVEVLKPIDVSPFRSFHVPVGYVSNIKLKIWSYEEEWRIIASKKDMGIPYSKAGLAVFPDHIGIKKNRQIKYKLETIEEICVGINFITARDFTIEWKDDLEFTITPNKDDVENFDVLCRFLDFVADNLSDKLYFSGTKYELDENQELFLIRTKEKMHIQKITRSKYTFIRSREIIRLLN